MIDKDFPRLVCLVTGASSGIGNAIAGRLLADGMTVIAAVRNLDRMIELETLGAHVVRMDLAEESSITAGFAAIAAAHGGVDVLVNNAGIGVFGPIECVTLADARRQFEVNLFGLAHLTQLVLPGMRAKRAGRIINISSTNGKVYAPLTAWYSASKHALEGWSDCLRLELRPLGVDVVIVEPGAIRTGFAAETIRSLAGLTGCNAYDEQIHKMARNVEKNEIRGIGSSPEVVASAVSVAIRARHPRARYAVGLAAKPMIWLRRCLSDRLFDRLILSIG